MITRFIRSAFALALAVGALMAWQTPANAQAMSDGHIVEVVAEDYAFEAPREIPSGWTTLRLSNEGDETHFLLLHRLPEGKTHDDYLVDVVEPFNQAWYPLRDGEVDQEEFLEVLGEAIPEWFADLEQLGGPGLIAPGRTAETTVDLKPGDYVLECYMKTDDGEFHVVEGMERPLTVTEASSGAAEPEADVRLTLSNFEIATEGEFRAGSQTVAVHIVEHPEDAFFGNDVHLVRLEDGTDVDEVVLWMNWMAIEGLDATAPFQFLGGAHEMPPGYTAYVTVDLEAGRYAWVAEETGARGVLEEFTVNR